MKFICKVYHPQENFILLNKEFNNLTELSNELGLTYQQVADISSKRRKPKEYRQFKFYPKIEIEKINIISKNNNNE